MKYRVFAAVLSGLLLTAAQPPFNASWLAWIALVPLLAAVKGQSGRIRFNLGFLTGLAHFTTLIYWVVVVLNTYGGLHVLLSVLVLLAFVTYLALYPGLFALLFPVMRKSPYAVFLGAGAWTAVEFARGWLLTGFPWGLLGYSQGTVPRLIQISDLAGVYGVSFLVAAVNVLVFVLAFDPRPSRKLPTALEGAGLALLIALTLFYGTHRMREVAEDYSRSGTEPVRTAVVQANIDQAVKWEPAFQEATLSTYLDLSRGAGRSNPDLLVWPETALPFFYQDREGLAQRVRNIAEETGADLLFGTPAYEGSGRSIRYYNRACLFMPGERSLTFYDKVHLVPFGEYVPLKRFLFFVERLVPAAGDFASGKRVAPLEGQGYSAGVLICFEAIFPGLTRAQTRRGADILVNLTNDAWFGRTGAPYQHLAMAAFRAVESRRPMVRAANTGFSAFVDPTGRITRKSGLFEEAVLVQDVRPSTLNPTFYTRHGDLFSFFLLAAVFAKLTGFYFTRSRS